MALQVVPLGVRTSRHEDTTDDDVLCKKLRTEHHKYKEATPAPDRKAGNSPSNPIPAPPLRTSSASFSLSSGPIEFRTLLLKAGLDSVHSDNSYNSPSDDYLRLQDPFSHALIQKQNFADLEVAYKWMLEEKPGVWNDQTPAIAAMPHPVAPPQKRSVQERDDFPVLLFTLMRFFEPHERTFPKLLEKGISQENVIITLKELRVGTLEEAVVYVQGQLRQSYALDGEEARQKYDEQAAVRYFSTSYVAPRKRGRLSSSEGISDGASAVAMLRYEDSLGERQAQRWGAHKERETSCPPSPQTPAHSSAGFSFDQYWRFLFRYLVWRSRGYATMDFARTIPTTDAIRVLKCVLMPLNPTLVQPLVDFLTEASARSGRSSLPTHRHINEDQWVQLKAFAQIMVEYPVLSHYSNSDCWPMLIDEFVEWTTPQRVRVNQ